jgi:hypothetical protein
MVTRNEIEAEAAFIQHLIDTANPTGGGHTPTPWQKAPGSLGDYGIAGAGDVGTLIANFLREEDRDLALYFVNAHAGMLAVMRNNADAFKFLAAVMDNSSCRDLALHHEELTRTYEAGFASMGETFAQAKAPEPGPEHTYPSNHDPRVPGAPPALVASFAIMDLLKPGAISHTARIYLAGLIRGLIETAYEQGADGEALRFERPAIWPTPQ